MASRIFAHSKKCDLIQFLVSCWQSFLHPLTHGRPNFITGSFLGQRSAMICVTTAGACKSLKFSTFTTFSCQRRVAHFLISCRGANLVTGTHRSLAFLRICRDAEPVFLGLSGLPSVITTTNVWTSARPNV